MKSPAWRLGASRTAVVAAALSALAVSGCSSTASTPPATSAPGPTATSASSAASGSSTSAATPSEAAKGSETPEAATAAVTQLVQAQAAAIAQTGQAGDTARAGVYIGKALEAANVGAQLLSTLSAAQKADLPLSMKDAVVLGVSSGAAYPRIIAAKVTTAASAQPVMLLLMAPDAATGYRIQAQSALLPGSVGALDPLSTGSSTRLTEAELATLTAAATAYGAAINYPDAPNSPLIVGDPYIEALRKSAADQGRSLGSAGSLTRTHSIVGFPAGMRLPSGRGFIAWAVLERSDTLTENTPDALAAPKPFTVLTGKSTIDKKAVLTTLEFLVFEVPATGPARVVAASEQLVAASGS